MDKKILLLLGLIVLAGSGFGVAKVTEDRKYRIQPINKRMQPIDKISISNLEMVEIPKARLVQIDVWQRGASGRIDEKIKCFANGIKARYNRLGHSIFERQLEVGKIYNLEVIAPGFEKWVGNLKISSDISTHLIYVTR